MDNKTILKPIISTRSRTCENAGREDEKSQLGFKPCWHGKEKRLSFVILAIPQSHTVGMMVNEFAEWKNDWRAVCDESRTHGLEGGCDTKSLTYLLEV